MTATVADVKLRDISGTFAALSDPQIQAYLDDATHRLGDPPGLWGDCYDLAHIYLTLHLLSGAVYGTVGGPITSASAGGISASFGGATLSGFGTQSTRWGQLFDELSLACGLVSPIVIVGQPLPDC